MNKGIIYLCYSLGEIVPKGVYPDKNTPKLILVSKEAQFYTDLPKKNPLMSSLGQKKLQNFL